MIPGSFTIYKLDKQFQSIQVSVYQNATTTPFVPLFYTISLFLLFFSKQINRLCKLLFSKKVYGPINSFSRTITRNKGNAGDWPCALHVSFLFF